MPNKDDLDAQTATSYDIKTGTLTEGSAANGYTSKVKKASVKAIFDKSKSTKRPGALTPALLKHEQYHFDIAHVWARYLEEDLKKICGTGANADAARADAAAKVQAARDKNVAQCERLSLVYDLFTDHGRNAGQQAAWCAKIGKWLAKLNGVNAKAVGEGEVQVRGGNGGNDFAPPSPRTLELSGVQVDVSGGTGAPLFVSLDLSRLAVRGFHMGGTVLLGPENPSDGPAVLRVLDPAGGADLMRAHVRTMTGASVGSQYTVWLEEWEMRDDVIDAAPAMAQIQALLGEPEHGVALLEIALSGPVDFTASGPEDRLGFVSVGTSDATDPADVDGDGVVDAGDIPFFEALYYGTLPPLTPVAGDLDSDGDVDIFDAILLHQRIFG